MNDTDITQIIIHNLIALRKKSGISYDTMAAYLRLSSDDYLSLEDGDYPITAEMIDKLNCLYLVDITRPLNIDILDIHNMHTFRVEELNNICAIHKIVRNQLEMDKLLHM